jgi:hypothetical protein
MSPPGKDVRDSFSITKDSQFLSQGSSPTMALTTQACGYWDSGNSLVKTSLTTVTLLTTNCPLSLTRSLMSSTSIHETLAG